MWLESNEEAHSEITEGVPAWIRQANGTLTAIIVVAMTDYGAELAVNPDVELPERFSLRLPHEPGRRTCCVIWRERDIVGVRLIAPDEQTPDDTSSLQDS